MESLKTKSCIVYDYGTFESIAERLAEDFGKVYYYSPWKSSYPFVRLIKIAEGIKNVERINNFFDYVDEADIFVFPDVMDGDLQLHLESLGKKVWGSRKGEDLEMKRVGTKKLLKELGLPVGKYEVVKGVTALRKYLKENKDVWVKVDVFRGDGETFHSINYDYIENRLEELDNKLGAVKETIEFICEENLDNKVEIGYDGYTVNGQFPNKTLFGIEVKDSCYVGLIKDYNKLPAPITDVNTKLTPILKKYGYKGFFSTEIRVGKDHKPYLIDPCCRCGMPPNESYQELYTNLSQIIWNGASGICVDPIVKDKYVAEVMIHCERAMKKWVPVLFPAKYKDNIKFSNYTVLDGKYIQVPKYNDITEIGAIVATGSSLDNCFEQIKEIAEQVKGYYLEIGTHTLDSAQEEIDKLKEYGYDVF